MNQKSHSENLNSKNIIVPKKKNMFKTSKSHFENAENVSVFLDYFQLRNNLEQQQTSKHLLKAVLLVF